MKAEYYRAKTDNDRGIINFGRRELLERLGNEDMVKRLFASDILQGAADKGKLEKFELCEENGMLKVRAVFANSLFEGPLTFIYTIFENGLTITIIDSGKGYDVDSIDVPNLEEPKESGLGLFIIQSLMDEVEIKSNINYGTVIKMTKYLGVDN